MNVTPRRPIFTRRPESNLYRMFFWLILALGGVWLILQIRAGQLKSPFDAPPTPTRTTASYTLEGDAQFTAGNIDASIAAYQQAVQVDPNNASAWAQLARIQTYSSSLLTTDQERIARLRQALQSAMKATQLAPDDSTAHAILAFTYDWNADPSLFPDAQVVQQSLADADGEALRALQLDTTNTLAMAYFAEILMDEQKWAQAQQYIKQALDQDPTLMDVHRVYAYVLENGGEYNQAIQEYDKAIAITPKLTFLYLRAGANYRTLGFKSPNEQNQTELFTKSLEYFAKAASINKELGVKDPIPYESIAKTYSQEGQYFIAARNMQTALGFQPNNPDLYGQLGIIYFKSRNYEGSIPALACAVKGCSGDASCQGRGLDACDAQDPPASVTGLPLSLGSIDYYQVYFSVLAALGPRDPTFCPEAQRVIALIHASGLEKQRPDITPNINAAQIECSPGTQSSVNTPTAVVTPQLLPTSTPYPTSTPLGGATP
ncbi:MAG TPA: tetratricopeptide repeat protein [Anaerolineales bacterium]